MTPIDVTSPRALRQRLHGLEREHDPEVLEAVAGVVDARDVELAAAEADDISDVLARVVAREHGPADAVRDDEAAVGELGRVEPEHEQAALDE